MNLDRPFAEIRVANFVPGRWALLPFGVFGATPLEASRWLEIYRIARERTEEALRPTRYDRALLAAIN
jgi:hypothetical protein